MQKHRNSGVVACAGNLKFGMSLPLASFSITKKYQKFRRRARPSKTLLKIMKIAFFTHFSRKNQDFKKHSVFRPEIVLLFKNKNTLLR